MKPNESKSAKEHPVSVIETEKQSRGTPLWFTARLYVKAYEYTNLRTGQRTGLT
jgi:hypothetical protein